MRFIQTIKIFQLLIKKLSKKINKTETVNLPKEIRKLNQTVDVNRFKNQTESVSHHIILNIIPNQNLCISSCSK